MLVRFERGAALALALALAVGCSAEEDPQTTIGDPPSEDEDDQDDEPEEVEEEPEESDEPDEDEQDDPAENDFAVPDDPDDIDAAYLEGLLAEFEQVYLDAVLALRDSDGDVTPATFQRLDAIYGPDEVDRSVEVVLADAENDFANIRPDDEVGPRTNDVEKIISASSQCVYVRVETEFSGIAVDEDVDPRDTYFRLERASTDQMSDQQRDYNSTPWIIAYDRTPIDRDDRESLEEDQCESS